MTATATKPSKTFLPLEFTKHHYGQPIEAQSEPIRHSWCDHDDTDVRAEFTIEYGFEDTINDPDTFHVWVKLEHHYTWPERYSTIAWYQSPRFARFADAEAYAQFAYQRWQDTSYLSSAAMELRDDLDEKRNPIA
ncbi:MAG: hypothetical protein EB075_09595 [Bacteroidetes bacterium]|nr:hypothetical protein [Bacteroidota bacterium]